MWKPKFLTEKAFLWMWAMIIASSIWGTSLSTGPNQATAVLGGTTLTVAVLLTLNSFWVSLDELKETVQYAWGGSVMFLGYVMLMAGSKASVASVDPAISTGTPAGIEILASVWLVFLSLAVVSTAMLGFRTYTQFDGGDENPSTPEEKVLGDDLNV